MKLALAMIVKGTDEEAVALNRCLSFVAKDVDGIFVTITQQNKKVEEVARYYNAHISHFEWCDDFAAARNFNFSQVPKDFDYILWLDADDAIRDAAKLKPTIEQHQEIDAFILNYLYAFDEWKNPTVVHQKTQIVKNDGCVKWVGKLHEDFQANREISQYFIKGIERIHLTDDHRVEIAKKRNLQVAEKDAKENPEDPRSFWNLGNSYYGMGKLPESLQAFEVFLSMSQSDEEKYIARLRRAEAYWRMGDNQKALDECRYAIGTRPLYPDAYHLAGSIYFNDHRFQEAEEMYLQGLTKKPPQYKIIVHNPRDYDYVPLMNLAKTYFNRSLPLQAMDCLKACAKIYPKNQEIKNLIKAVQPEVNRFNRMLKLVEPLQKLSDKIASGKGTKTTKAKLLAGIEALPDDIQQLPAVCNLRNINFIKETSSGKDVVFFCGFTGEEWNPDIIKKNGIGGSEEAVMWISELLAKRGFNVTVYNNCGHKAKVFNGVTYKPFWAYNYRDKQDITVLWRTLKPLDWEINSTKIFVDLHDVMPVAEFTPNRIKKINKILVKSEFHKSFFPNVPSEKFAVIPNGIDVKAFDLDIPRDPNLIVNTSSADRSLEALLDIFDMVKKSHKDAKLKWAYGWGVFDAMHKDNPKMLEWKERMMHRIENTEGVTALGRINHEEIVKLMSEANVYAYPTEFAEIFCISAVKGQAAGCFPVTTDFAALAETVRSGRRIHSDKTKDNWSDRPQFSLEDQKKKREMADAIIHELKHPMPEKLRTDLIRKKVEMYDWEKVADEWAKLL